MPVNLNIDEFKILKKGSSNPFDSDDLANGKMPKNIEIMSNDESDSDSKDGKSPDGQDGKNSKSSKSNSKEKDNKDNNGSGSGEKEEKHKVTGVEHIKPLERGAGGILTPKEAKDICEGNGLEYENPHLDEGKIDEIITNELSENTLNKSKTAGGAVKSRGLREVLSGLVKPQIDWKKALKKYIGKAPIGTEEVLGDRRFIHSGDYIWTDKSKEKGRIKDAVCAIDVSGSMSPDEIAIILTEVKSMVEVKKIKNTHLIYFHDNIEHEITLNSEAAVKKYIPKELKSGGTLFNPPIKRMQELFNKNKLEIGIFLTDGFNFDDRLYKPKFLNRFIWVILNNPGFKPPFGSMVLYISSNNL